MTASNHFKCACEHCHGHIECPLEAAGAMVACPHCGKQTRLTIPSRATPLRKIFFLSFILIIVAAGVALLAVKSADRKKQRQIETAEAARLAAQAAAHTEALANDPLAQAGWRITDVKLEKTSGSTIVHAVGKLQNETDRRRFGVKVHLDLLDAADQKIGAATDYQASIEPHAQWQFAALATNAKATAAKVAAVEESP